MLRSGLDGVSTQTRAHVVVEIGGEVVVELLGRDVGEAVALRLVHLRRHPVDAAVDVGDQDDPLARVDEMHERRRRPDPRAERDAVRRVLEVGESNWSAVRVGLATRE